MCVTAVLDNMTTKSAKKRNMLSKLTVDKNILLCYNIQVVSKATYHSDTKSTLKKVLKNFKKGIDKAETL